MTSSITSQNSEKNKIRAKVQVLTKTQSLLEQAGLEQGNRCKSASVTQPAISATAMTLGLAGPLASPSMRRYPQSDNWKAVVVVVKRFSECFGTATLLMELALGQVRGCLFPNDAVRELKDEVVDVLSSRGFQQNREGGDRDELPIDFRFLDLLLRAAEDPDTQRGTFAQ